MSLIQRRVDGVLLVPAAGSRCRSPALLREHGLPVVVLDICTYAPSRWMRCAPT